MGSIQGPVFGAVPETISVHALLFDFDGRRSYTLKEDILRLRIDADKFHKGTIIDSTQAIVKHWHKIGSEMGVDPNVILATSHGRRSIDVIKLYDPSRANWEYIKQMEGLIPREYGHDAVEIPGARKLLTDLDTINAPWAIVTSGTGPLLTGWLEVLKLAHPKTLVVAEDVENGKPDPACYLLGKRKLGLAVSNDIVVVEDAPAGIRAGKAAGFRVIGLTTSHSVQQVVDAGADWVVQDLESVSVKNFSNGTIHLEIKDALLF